MKLKSDGKNLLKTVPLLHTTGLTPFSSIQFVSIVDILHWMMKYPNLSPLLTYLLPLDINSCQSSPYLWIWVRIMKHRVRIVVVAVVNVIITLYVSGEDY